MDTVYIETSIVSHATAWPSPDILIAALQQQARDWWANERPKFELVTSQLVITEASAGDASAVADRMKLLDGLPLVPITSRAQSVANAILSTSYFPDATEGRRRCASRWHCGSFGRKILIDA